MADYNPKWLPIIKQHEDALYFDSFCNADALQIGLNMVEAAKALEKTVAIRIIANGAILFSHHMDGTSLNNDWWMKRKANTCSKTGISGLRFFCEINGGERERPDFLDLEGNYCWHGGCFPLRYKDGSVFGYAIASGAPHEYDHEIVVRGIAKLLGIEVPSLV